MRLIDRGQLANPVTLKTFFSATEEGQTTEIEDYLGELADGVISIAQADRLCRHHLRDTSPCCELILIGDDVISDASHPMWTFRPPQIDYEAKLFQLAETGEAGAGLRSFENVAAASINQAAIALKSDGGLSGYSTGLTGLNNKMGGLHRSDLIILAARPAMGKTALVATNIAFHVATTRRTGEGCKIAFFSLEMSAGQLATRMLSEQTGISSEVIRKGEINKDQFGTIYNVARELETLDFFIDDTPALPVAGCVPVPGGSSASTAAST